jgi:magnesium transporter
MSRPGYRASGRDWTTHQLNTEEVGYDDGTHRRYLPTIRPLSRHPEADLIPIPSPPPDSIIAWAWYVNGVRKPAEDLSVAARLANAGEGFVWLGLKDPRDEDLMVLASQFDLHPLAIEDAAHGHTRSKLEMFGDDLFMVISTVSYVEHDELTDTSEVVATGQVMVFLGEHFVITVRRGEHAQLSSLRRTMEADPARLARGPSEVLYAIADKIIDDYLDVVAEIEKDIDEIESLVFARHVGRDVDRVYQLKRELIEFKRCVMPLGAPLLRLATRELPVIPPQAKAYFRELADHHTEAREAVASFDEVLSSILQAGLARASVADNEDMRKISGWVAIVVVPTLVAGIYGMNFDNMPELHWKYGYFIVLGVMLLIMISLYVGFKRNKWL